MTSDVRHTPKSLRVRLGLSVQEVADLAKVSPRTVLYVEAGRDATVDTLRAVALALGVTLDVLIAAHDVERERRATEVSRSRPHRRQRRAKGAA